MTVDDSFTKPGSVPFDWEIRPGVPKTPLHPNQQPPPAPSPPVTPPPQALRTTARHSRLKPPPPGLHFFPPEKPRAGSFRSSASKDHSARWSLELPLVGQRTAVAVVSSGCFPARRKESKKRRGQSKLEPNYVSDTDTPSFWSVSSRRSSVSPLQGSPSSAYSFRSFQSSPRRSVSSHGSYKPSPQCMSDADWAAFGLF